MPEWRKITGYAQVISLQPQLVALAESCGQSGCMDHLEYHLSAPYISASLSGRVVWSQGATLSFFKRSRRPTVLIETRLGRLTAAVLLYEHIVCRLATGVFIPLDLDGLQTIVAPSARRVDVAKQAAEFLLSQGASIVMLSLNNGFAIHGAGRAHPSGQLEASQLASPAINVGVASREVSRFLPLANSYDATLSRMGPRTRRNLRALSRKAVERFDVVFVPNAQLDLEEFLNLSHASAFSVPDWVATWRYHSVRSQNGVVTAGLRTADGSWLSLVGARRSAETIMIDWQLNRLDSGLSSLGTVMRSFLIANEIDRGTRGMRFEGGTSHSIQRSFEAEHIYDFLFTRRELSPAIMRSLAHLFQAGGRLREMMLSGKVTWLRARSTKRTVRCQRKA